MENINELRNSIRTYIQSFTQHMLLKKIKDKNTHFWTKKQLFTNNKKRNLKSRSLLALNGHPVNLILSVSQSSCSMTRNIVTRFSFLVFMYKYLFLLQFTTKFGVVEHKVSEIHSTTSRRFNYIYLNCSFHFWMFNWVAFKVR